jgi:hypothetical protein
VSGIKLVVNDFGSITFVNALPLSSMIDQPYVNTLGAFLILDWNISIRERSPSPYCAHNLLAQKRSKRNESNNFRI